MDPIGIRHAGECRLMPLAGGFFRENHHVHVGIRGRGHAVFPF